MHLPGKIALITGGARGIGRAIAEAFLAGGAKVCLVDIRLSKLTATQEELRGRFSDQQVIVYEADVTNADQLEAAFLYAISNFHHLDIVVNNAGIAKEKRWEKMIQVNLCAVIRGTELALGVFTEETKGVIINVSSICAVSPREHNLVPVYSASKAGVAAYSQSVSQAADVKKKRARVVVICPDMTETDLLSRDEEGPRDMEVAMAMAASLTGSPKLLSPATVAGVCVQLVEDDTKNGILAVVTYPNNVEFMTSSVNLL